MPLLNSSILYIESDYIRASSKIKTTLDLAREALQLSIQSYKFGTDTNSIVGQQIDDLASKALHRIKLMKGADIRGRISADVAYDFALAGVTCPKLYDMLLNIAFRELSRFGYRSQCKPTTICHMVEKFAAAGCNFNTRDNNNLISLSYKILKDRGYDDLASKFDDNSFDFFSDMSLLWLWRFSAKQSKVNPSFSHHHHFTNTTEVSPQRQPSSPILAWNQLYQDPTRPLIIDLGSGMGVSLLGLATAKAETTTSRASVIDIDWSGCNFLGVELNTSLVRFAIGIASRWQVSHKLQYISIPAESMIEYVHKTYPGQVKMVMIQFPTPYRLQQQRQQPPQTTELQRAKDNISQDQHRESVHMENAKIDRNTFMVTTQLLDGISSVLEKKQTDIHKKDYGYLLLQSNSEDVAIYMKNQAEASDCFSSISVPSPVRTENDMVGNITWRTKRMLQKQRGIDGINKHRNYEEQHRHRAIGRAWSKEKILPSRARSETEVSCLYNGAPIHRCILLQRMS